MPAPSPVLFSHPHAPRWLRLLSAVRPSRTIWCDFRPLRSTMKPTPQLSCSLRVVETLGVVGRYSSWLSFANLSFAH